MVLTFHLPSFICLRAVEVSLCLVASPQAAAGYRTNSSFCWHGPLLQTLVPNGKTAIKKWKTTSSQEKWHFSSAHPVFCLFEGGVGSTGMKSAPAWIGPQIQNIIRHAVEVFIFLDLLFP